MIPEGWKITRLNNLLNCIIDYRGKSVPKSDSGVQLITARNVKNGFLDLSKSEFIAEEAYDSWMVKGIPNSNDLLFTTEAPLGNVCMFPDSGIYAIGQRVVTLKTKNNVLYALFLLYFFQSKGGKKSIYRFASGSTAKGIKSSELRKILILHPPFLEQRKIARILSIWDKAIDTVERLIENSKKQKKALKQQLLTGKKRFPGFEDEWRKVKLSSICQRVTERNLGQSSNVVTISAQYGLIKQEEFFKKLVSSKTLDNYYILRNGQFAYNKSYSNGYPMGTIKRLNRYSEAVVTSLYICFEVRYEINTNSDFLELYFESGLLNRGLTRVAAEGGRAHGLLNVKPADFMGLAICLPSFEEQKRIADFINTNWQEIQNFEQQLQQLQIQKKALMQQLLTGKRRVYLKDGDGIYDS